VFCVWRFSSSSPAASTWSRRKNLRWWNSSTSVKPAIIATGGTFLGKRNVPRVTIAPRIRSVPRLVPWERLTAWRNQRQRRIAPSVHQATIALEWDWRLPLDCVRPDISVRLDPFIRTKNLVQRAITVLRAVAFPPPAPLAPMDPTYL